MRDYYSEDTWPYFSVLCLQVSALCWSPDESFLATLEEGCGNIKVVLFITLYFSYRESCLKMLSPPPPLPPSPAVVGDGRGRRCEGGAQLLRPRLFLSGLAPAEQRYWKTASGKVHTKNHFLNSEHYFDFILTVEP